MLDYAAVRGWKADDAMRCAAAAETDSEHPIARAVVAVGDEIGDIPTASELATDAGRGVAAVVRGSRVAVGGSALLARLGLLEPNQLTVRTDGWRAHGGAVLHVVVDALVVGAFTVADEIRPESQAAVEGLHERNVRVIMITGDARQVAEAVAGQLDIDEVMAGVSSCAQPTWTHPRSGAAS